MATKGTEEEGEGITTEDTEARRRNREGIVIAAKRHKRHRREILSVR